MCQCDTDVPAQSHCFEGKSLPDRFTNIDKIWAGFVTCQYADIYYIVCQVPSIHLCNKEQKQNSNMI